MHRDLIERLKCTVCDGTNVGLGSARRPTLRCDDCETSFPIVDDIVDMVAPTPQGRPGGYRTDTVPDVLGGMSDIAAPLMSLAVWHCSPLRYVDVSHRAVGRANPGTFLAAPIGTGIVLDRVLAPYHDTTVIGIDSSWKVLRKAKRRFAGHERVYLIRAPLDRLPLRSQTIDSVSSLNGLHSVTNRAATLAELRRVCAPGGYFSGTALIRGQELVADAVLDRYERWGLLPMLRTAEYLVAHIRDAGFEDVCFETHGAVLFFSGHSPNS